MLSGSDGPGAPSVDAGDCKPAEDTTQGAEGPEPAADPTAHDEESRGPGRYDQSRWNSSKEGLRARLLLPEALQAAADQRTAAYMEEFKPATAYTSWLVSQIGLATAKIDQAEEMLRIDARRASIARQATGSTIATFTHTTWASGSGATRCACWPSC
jgi:hypothetical protein